MSLDRPSCIWPPSIVALHVDHRIAELARLQGAADALLGRRQELRRQRFRRNCVHDDDAARSASVRLEIDGQLGEQARRARLLDAFAFDLDVPAAASRGS